MIVALAAAVTLVAAAAVLGGRAGHQEDRNDASGSDAALLAHYAFCFGIDGDVATVVEGLSGDVPRWQRAATRSSVGIYFNPWFVHGAPPSERDEAQQIVDDVTALRDGPVRPGTAARVLRTYSAVQAASRDDCAP